MKKLLVVLVLGMTMFSCSKEDVQENNLIDNMMDNIYMSEYGSNGYEFITETTLNEVYFDSAEDCNYRSFLATGDYEWYAVESTKDVHRIKTSNWTDWELEFTKVSDNSITFRSRVSLTAGGGDWTVPYKLYVNNEITFCD